MTFLVISTSERGELKISGAKSHDKCMSFSLFYFLQLAVNHII